MLNTLLESRSRRSRNGAGATLSAAVHASLIVVAAYATAAGAPPPVAVDNPAKIVWVNTATPASSAPARAPAASALVPTRSALPRPLSVSIDIPSTLPPASVPLGAINPADFAQPSGNNLTATIDTAGGPGSGGGQRAYTADEVETPVGTIRGGSRPEYPQALRSTGIEGQVIAQFVVDESGRAQRETVRIVSATNDLFAESVRRAVHGMRFSPARIGGRPVPQAVQQLFVFRLDR